MNTTEKMTLATCIVWLLVVGGCLSAFHREDVDNYDGACATAQGNGRQTTMSTSRPSTQPSITPIHQTEPGIGEVFNLRIKGKTYEAMKKTDGKVYILREVK
jgi:hypothetical protein